MLSVAISPYAWSVLCIRDWSGNRVNKFVRHARRKNRRWARALYTRYYKLDWRRLTRCAYSERCRADATTVLKRAASPPPRSCGLTDSAKFCTRLAAAAAVLQLKLLRVSDARARRWVGYRPSELLYCILRRRIMAILRVITSVRRSTRRIALSRPISRADLEQHSETVPQIVRCGRGSRSPENLFLPSVG